LGNKGGIDTWLKSRIGGKTLKEKMKNHGGGSLEKPYSSDMDSSTFGEIRD
jgi:hypothetical protein